MGGATSLYERDGDAFVATGATRGGWHHGGQSGGAVLALLGHVLEDVPTLTPMSLTRMTADIVRPVPIATPMTIATEVTREGKRIQVVDLVVVADGEVCTRARALRIRDEDLSGVDMPSTTDLDPAAAVPPPDELDAVDRHEGCADFLRFGAELRRTTEPIDGMHAACVRLRLPVVDGEPVRPTSLVTLPMDCVNLIGVQGLPAGASAMNADVSAHVMRAPVGEWVTMTGNTRFATSVGHGFSSAIMSDERGVFGSTSTTQIVQLH